MHKKTGFKSLSNVRRIRFELTHPFVWALPPQGSASTNFATAANLMIGETNIENFRVISDE